MKFKPGHCSSMSGRAAAKGAFLAIALLLDVHSVLAQPRALDVPYVPTPEHIVEAMLRLAKPTKNDFLVDLGCGDGRIPVAAAQRFGTRGFGVDLNPERIKEARANALKAGVGDKVEFVEGDLFKTDFMKATVLTLYLLPSVNMRLRASILEMKPGTRVVSHAFHMEDWKPDASEAHEFRHVYSWIVPAKVAGRWAGTAGGARIELEIEQKFQELSGAGTIDGKPVKIENGTVAGEAVILSIDLADGKTSRLGLTLVGTCSRAPASACGNCGRGRRLPGFCPLN